MKVYKGEDFDELFARLQSEDNKPKEGAVFVTRSKDYEPNGEKWTVWHHRVLGVYDPRAEFKRLKDATKFALALENPTMMDNGYQIIRLSADSSLCVYYHQYESIVHKLAETLGANPTDDYEVYRLGETGILSRIVVDEGKRDDNEKYGLHADLLDEFTRYLSSDMRTERFKTHPEPPIGLSLEERMADVGHWDVENFLFDRAQGIRY